MSTRRRMQRYPAHCYWSSSCNAELRCVKSLWVRSTGSTWVWGLVRVRVRVKAKPGWSGPGQVHVRTWFGFWFDTVRQSQTGVVRSWSGPCSNLVWVLVRHGYDKAKPVWSGLWTGPGSNLVRSLFEPGLGFGSTRLGQQPNRDGQVLVRPWWGPG